MANGKVQITDQTGQPRTKENLEEALQAIEHTMVEDVLKVPPRLAVLLSTIREALVELLERRKKDG